MKTFRKWQAARPAQAVAVYDQESDQPEEDPSLEEPDDGVEEVTELPLDPTPAEEGDQHEIEKEVEAEIAGLPK